VKYGQYPVHGHFVSSSILARTGRVYRRAPPFFEKGNNARNARSRFWFRPKRLKQFSFREQYKLSFSAIIPHSLSLTSAYLKNCAFSTPVAFHGHYPAS
jgi:hypothetical protein